MTKFSFFIFLFVLAQTSDGQTQTTGTKNTKELYIIGTVHSPTEKLNTDTILNILQEIKPSLILIEADHHVFDEDYQFKKTYGGNEWNAILKYQELNPETKFRPFEIEGRNHLRKELGIYSEAGFVYNKIYDMDSLNQLTSDQSKIWRRSLFLSDSLAMIDSRSIQELNSEATDNLVEEKQFYQYKKIKEIVDEHSLFSDRKIPGSNGDSLTVKKYFELYSDFEQLRNHEMAQNVLKWTNETEDQKIVVLVGYYHRFALINELRFKQKESGFKLQEIG